MKMQIRGLGQLHYLHMELSLLQRKTYIYSEMFPVKNVGDLLWKWTFIKIPC